MIQIIEDEKGLSLYDKIYVIEFERFISELKDELCMIQNCNEDISDEEAIKINKKICDTIDKLKSIY